MPAERRDHSIAPPHPLIVAARAAPAGGSAWAAIARGLFAFGFALGVIVLVAYAAPGLFVAVIALVEWLR